MQAGLLNESITVMREVSVRDEYGAVKTELATRCTPRCRVIYGGGNKSEVNGQISQNYQRTFVVRIHNDIDESDLIEYKGILYKITSLDPDRRGQQLTIHTQKIKKV